MIDMKTRINKKIEINNENTYESGKGGGL